MSAGRTRRAVVTMSVSAGAVVSVLMIPPGYGVGVLTCVPRSGVAPGAPTRVERGTRGRPGGLPKPGRLGNSVERHRADAAVDSLVRALVRAVRSEEHTSELQSLMRSSYAVFCLKKKKKKK